MSSSVTMSVIQQVTATLLAEDALGHPAPLAGTPSWSSSDTTIFTVAPATGGMTAVLTAVGKVGSATLTVSATPAKPDGTADTAITSTASVAVTSAEASQLVITFGTPTLQTPPTPPPPPAP